MQSVCLLELRQLWGSSVENAQQLSPVGFNYLVPLALMERNDEKKCLFGSLKRV